MFRSNTKCVSNTNPSTKTKKLRKPPVFNVYEDQEEECIKKDSLVSNLDCTSTKDSCINSSDTSYTKNVEHNIQDNTSLNKNLNYNTANMDLGNGD